MKEVDESKSRLKQLQFDLQRLRDLAALRKESLDEATEELRTKRYSQQEEMAAHVRADRRAAEIESLYQSFRASSKALDASDRDIERYDERKRDCDAELSHLEKRHHNVMGEFQRIFDHVSRVLLGESVAASVRFKGKAIEPELHFNGVRNSVALQVAKWVAFDLASVAFSMGNAGSFHPRLLIHDSPREADLANIIYAELFRFARNLEDASGGNSAFQYIITTTEPPPGELQQRPWLIQPILDASSPESRLLGLNLGT